MKQETENKSRIFLRPKVQQKKDECGIPDKPVKIFVVNYKRGEFNFVYCKNADKTPDTVVCKITHSKCTHTS